MTKHRRGHISGDESKQPDTKILQEEAQARRDFLKRAAAVGVAAPAVMLLLSVKPPQAVANYAPTPADQA